MMSKTISRVVVNHTYSLHKGVDDFRTDKAETSVFHIGADSIR